MADIQPLEFGENLRPSTVGAMNKINEIIENVNLKDKYRSFIIVKGNQLLYPSSMDELIELFEFVRNSETAKYYQAHKPIPIAIRLDDYYVFNAAMILKTCSMACNTDGTVTSLNIEYENYTFQSDGQYLVKSYKSTLTINLNSISYQRIEYRLSNS